MSNLADFLGGGAVPIGGLLSIAGAPSLIADNGAEYLKTGVLASAAGYGALIASNPGLRCNVVTAEPGTDRSVGYVTAVGAAYYYCNGTDVSYNGAAMSFFGADIKASPASGIRKGGREAFTIGGKLVVVGAGTEHYTLNAGVATLQSPAVTFYCGAANAAGDLAVLAAAASGAGGIYTSTNGTAWTSRTPNGAGSIYLAVWSPAANAFIYVTSSAIAYTTPDGYTLTNRGAISASVSGLTTLGGNSSAASSPTSTLLSIQGYKGTISNTVNVLVRTTDGITYTSRFAADVFGMSGTPVISYINGAYYAVIGTNIFKSTDDGLTFAALPQVVNTLYPGVDLALSRDAAGNFAVVHRNSNGPTFSSIADLAATTHVGVPVGSANTYVRTK